MKAPSTRLQQRRALLRLAPAALAASLLPAQSQVSVPTIPRQEPPDDVRLPNGKKQQEAILKDDYEQNVKDARALIDVAKSFEEDLEKDERYVLSLGSLKKL